MEDHPYFAESAAILAAGQGTRLKTPGVAKALFPICDKPLISFGIDALIALGFRTIWIVKYVEHDYSLLDALYRDSCVEIRYVCEETTQGSLHSFALLRRHIFGSFFLLDCDLVFRARDFVASARRGAEAMRSRDLLGVVARVLHPSKSDETNVLLVKNGLAKRFNKSGGVGYDRGGYAYIWRPEIFQEVDGFLATGKTLSTYFDYVMRTREVGVMDVEDLMDVDTLADAAFARAQRERVDRHA